MCGILGTFNLEVSKDRINYCLNKICSRMICAALCIGGSLYWICLSKEDNQHKTIKYYVTFCVYMLEHFLRAIPISLIELVKQNGIQGIGYEKILVLGEKWSELSAL